MIGTNFTFLPAGLCAFLWAIALAYGEDLRRIDVAGAWEAHDDRPVGMRGDGMFDGRGEVLELEDERLEDRHQRADELALRVRFRLAGVPGHGVDTAQQMFARVVVHDDDVELWRHERELYELPGPPCGVLDTRMIPATIRATPAHRSPPTVSPLIES